MHGAPVQGALSDVPVPGQGIHQACRGPAEQAGQSRPDDLFHRHHVPQNGAGGPEPAEGPGHHHRALPHQLPVRSAGDPGKARRMRPAEETVVRQCAPTLAGIKTGSLFPCPYQSRQQLLADIRRMNRVLVPRGLCLLPMRMDDGRALLYLYRPQALRRDLGDDLACRLLRQAGYPCDSCGRCVARLVQRLRTEEEFPHEVGLFLSYPPEDVQGFIDHRAMDFKCAGLWKVYGDQQRAQALFDRFRRCTQRYCALWQTGLRLEQLAVAV